MEWKSREEVPGTKAPDENDQAPIDIDFCYKVTCNVPRTNREATNSLNAPHEKSKKKPTAALSTCKAEHMALTKATQEGLYLTQLSNEMDPLQEYALVKIFRGTQEVKYHFIGDALHNGSINIIYCPKADSLADFLTKNPN